MGSVEFHMSVWEREFGIKKSHGGLSPVVYFLMMFYRANWRKFWHTAYDFGVVKITKSLAVQGFVGLVICEWFHCWEQ